MPSDNAQPNTTPDLTPQDSDVPLFERDGYELPLPPGAAKPTPPAADPKKEDGAAADAAGDDQDDADQGDDAEDADDQTIDQKLTAAREAAVKKSGGNEEDPLVQRIDAMQKEMDALKESQAPAAAADDEKGIDNPKGPGDPNKGWWEEGSRRNPPSWRSIIERAKQESIDEAVEKSVAATLDGIKNADTQNRAHQTEMQQRLNNELDSLIEGGLVKKEEINDLVQFALDVKSPDIFSAFKGWSRGRQTAAAEDDQDQEDDSQQRRQMASKSNRRSPVIAKGKRLTYKELHLKSMDDVVENAMRSLKRN